MQTAGEYEYIIIIMYMYHAIINALSAHMIHINVNMIFYTHVEHSPAKTISIKYYMEKQTNARTTHTHTHTMTVVERRKDCKIRLSVRIFAGHFFN